MKIEHLFQVMVAEIAFQEFTLNALSAFLEKKLNVSRDEVETFVDGYEREKRGAYVRSVKARMERRLEELAH
jgi:hypothetical protein